MRCATFTDGTPPTMSTRARIAPLSRDIIRKALQLVRPQFRLDFEGGIHGVPHWSRVWFHGRRLAASMDINPAVLAWFAFLHDSQRHNDGGDPRHRHRAADFALGLRRDGLVGELAPLEFEQLCEAMRLHSDGHTESDPAIIACWDVQTGSILAGWASHHGRTGCARHTQGCRGRSTRHSNCRTGTCGGTVGEAEPITP
jgi:uncharacterized protein